MVSRTRKFGERTVTFKEDTGVILIEDGDMIMSRFFLDFSKKGFPIVCRYGDESGLTKTIAKWLRDRAEKSLTRLPEKSRRVAARYVLKKSRRYSEEARKFINAMLQTRGMESLVFEESSERTGYLEYLAVLYDENKNGKTI